MDRLERGGRPRSLGLGHLRERPAVEVRGAALVGRAGELLGDADDLAVSVIVDVCGDHHGHVPVGAFPAALQVDPVDVGVRVGALGRVVTPFLD